MTRDAFAEVGYSLNIDRSIANKSLATSGLLLLLVVVVVVVVKSI